MMTHPMPCEVVGIGLGAKVGWMRRLLQGLKFQRP
jgi:hypothetical protein